MTVRRTLLALLAAAMLLGAAGCGGSDGAPLAVETDEPLYVQGRQLVRQGRHQEALANFLRVIEKRGDQAAPESHFEVGLICLTQLKDQVEAIHHFKAYLNQKPNSTQAAGVHDLINTAKREYLKTLLGGSADDYAVKAKGSPDVEQLRKENEELRAQLATLRGGGTAPASQASGRGLLAFDNSGGTPGGTRTLAADDSPLQAPPQRVSPTTARPLLVPAPAPTNSRQAATPAAPTGKRHKVAQGETLWAIAKKYDGVNTSKKMREIVAANPQVFPGGNINTLPLGTDLVIP